jgi:methylglutaconyl-CoA hydratase
MDPSKTVLIESRDGVVYLTLNRPDKRNALNDQIIAELKAALRAANANEATRCIVLRGAGTDFCSGADLSALQKIANASVAENLEDAGSLMELFLLMRELNVPVIAAVHGRALAGGCGLALACDMVLADPAARFGFPEVKIGFVPAMVAAILRRTASEKKAFELLATGKELSSDDAERAGLVNAVYDSNEFDSEVEAFARVFTKLSRSAISLTKKLFYATDATSFSDALNAGVDVNATARATRDCREGIARFLKKQS